jgi:hypothetical protein
MSIADHLERAAPFVILDASPIIQLTIESALFQITKAFSTGHEPLDASHSRNAAKIVQHGHIAVADGQLQFLASKLLLAISNSAITKSLRSSFNNVSDSDSTNSGNSNYPCGEINQKRVGRCRLLIDGLCAWSHANIRFDPRNIMGQCARGLGQREFIKSWLIQASCSCQ